MQSLSRNEWDPLKRVIVGDASDAKIPSLDISLRHINYANLLDTSQIPVGAYPDQVIEEANIDLEILVLFLQSLGVEVLRPDIAFPNNYYHYCPRDGVLVYDDKIIICPQPLASRRTEYQALVHAFQKYDTQYQKLELSGSERLYNIECVGNPDVLALTEHEPAFDAANILRANDDLFYLVSNSGNLAGARLLQNIVGDSKRVWPIQGIYSYMHIDSTIALLREGLMLLNPARIKSIDQLPKPLQSWDVIWCPEPVDIGYYPGYEMASQWIGMNLLSINPNLVVLEEHQIPLQKELAKYGIESAMLPGRHQRTLSGGFHCVTLDLERG